MIAMVTVGSGLALLAYVYWGYGVILKVLVRGRLAQWARPGMHERHGPSVTVLLTVHNEERTVERRLRNLLLEQDYRAGPMDVVVASDGSTDRTDELILALAREWPIRLIRTKRVGKSLAQNAAMREIKSDIVVLTDAEASFDRSCISAMVAEFADPEVGCVTAELHLVDARGAIGCSQGLYWSYELKLRRLESRLGILAVASGSCMAFRRRLFNLLPSEAGDDCVIPLEVVRQGYRVVHSSAARAFDRMADREEDALRARVRMTTRNWVGTWLYPELINPFCNPGYAFALWSHKLLRWLSSIALLVMAAAALTIASSGAGWLAAVCCILFLAGAFLGRWCARRGRSVPILGTIYSFLLANLGFIIGIGRAVLGQHVRAYR